MKTLRIFFFCVLAIVLVAGSIFLFSGILLKKTVTTMGPSLLKVPVELDEIRFNPIKGHVEIQALTIHNPESFKSPYALQIKDFAVKLSPGSLFAETLHIHEIRLDGATLISEGLRADNHRAIIANLKKDKPDAIKNQPKAKNEPQSETSQSTKTLIIDHFSFTNSQLIIIVDGETITKVDFPEIELVEIGKKGAAVSSTEAIAQIYTAIASETTKVLTVNKDVIKALANAKLKKFGIKDIEELKNPGEILKDPEAIGNILNSLLQPDD